jgi:hypothetical protein
LKALQLIPAFGEAGQLVKLSSSSYSMINLWSQHLPPYLIQLSLYAKSILYPLPFNDTFMPIKKKGFI